MNPNLYVSIDELKDNRKLENMYEEILQKRGQAAASGSSQGLYFCKMYLKWPLL